MDGRLINLICWLPKHIFQAKRFSFVIGLKELKGDVLNGWSEFSQSIGFWWSFNEKFPFKSQKKISERLKLLQHYWERERLKTGSHYAVNLLWPAIRLLSLDNFTLFQSNLWQRSPQQQLQQPSISVHKPIPTQICCRQSDQIRKKSTSLAKL